VTSLGKEDVIDRRYIQNPEEPVYDVKERRHIDVPGLTDGADLTTVFTTIYRTNRWGSAETRSGTGSERARTKKVSLELSRLIRELNIRSVLDIPCGDFNWMQDVSLDDVRYSGYDIVTEMIRANSARHGRPGRAFRVLDFTADPVPAADLNADLILCRDALVHLSYQHIFAALKHFHDSGSKYLLTTTFLETQENVDIGAGWWRPINLQRSPFNLPEPLRILSDADSDDFYGDKVLAMWDLQAIAL
jgi:hypothetical protein